MKIAYLASRPLGLKLLKFLLHEQQKKGKGYIEIVCLVTLGENEIEKSGIDRWWRGSLISLAEKNKIPVVKVSDIPSFYPDMIFSVFYYDVLEEKIINSVPKGAVNLHFGYLPNALYHDKRTKNTYRGRGVLSYAILNAEKWQAVTFHYITKKIDLGPVIEYAWSKIGSKTTVWDLQKRSEKKAYQMFKKWLPEFITSKSKVKTLPEGNGKYPYWTNRDLVEFKKIKKTDSPEVADLKIRAFDFPGRKKSFKEKN